MVKEIYFAGRFNKLSDPDLSLPQRLRNDYRARLLGSPEALTYYNENLLLPGGHRYVGCFYCEKASSGVLTSTDCQAVVSEELKQIDQCNLFVVVLEEEFSTGSIAELIYAATQKKKIIIFYKRQPGRYSLKSEYWFAMVSAQHLSPQTQFVIYEDENQLHAAIRNLLENQHEI